MARPKRPMIGLKASAEDLKRIEAIRRDLGSYANVADAIRAALYERCERRGLKWQEIQVATQTTNVLRVKRGK